MLRFRLASTMCGTEAGSGSSMKANGRWIVARSCPCDTE